jgi:hypothetical protein
MPVEQGATGRLHCGTGRARGWCRRLTWYVMQAGEGDGEERFSPIERQRDLDRFYELETLA